MGPWVYQVYTKSFSATYNLSSGNQWHPKPLMHVLTCTWIIGINRDSYNRSPTTLTSLGCIQTCRNTTQLDQGLEKITAGSPSPPSHAPDHVSPVIHYSWYSRALLRQRMALAHLPPTPTNLLDKTIPIKTTPINPLVSLFFGWLSNPWVSGGG